MRISSLRIGLILAVIGTVAIMMIFDDNQKITAVRTLELEDTYSLNLDLKDGGIGYYKITVPNFDGQAVFVQIEDNFGNVVSDKKYRQKCPSITLISHQVESIR